MRRLPTIKFKLGKVDKNFTMIPNGLITDSNLSCRSRLLMVYLLSRPEEWTVRSGDLQKVLASGRDAIRAAIKQLEGQGFLKRETIHDDGGTFTGIEYEVVYPPCPENPAPVNQATDQPAPENTSPYKEGEGSKTESTKKEDRKTEGPGSCLKEVFFSPDEFRFIGIGDELYGEWVEKYPTVNVLTSIDRARVWISIKKRWERTGDLWDFLDNWLHREAHGCDKPGYKQRKRSQNNGGRSLAEILTAAEQEETEHD